MRNYKKADEVKKTASTKNTKTSTKATKAKKEQVDKYEVRRYVTLEVEFIENVPKKDYDGAKMDPKDQREWEQNLKKLLKADSVNIKKVKDFLGE